MQAHEQTQSYQVSTENFEALAYNLFCVYLCLVMCVWEPALFQGWFQNHKKGAQMRLVHIYKCVA